MPRQKSRSEEELDRLLAQQKAGTYVDPVEDARKFLKDTESKWTVPNRDAENTEIEKLKAESHYGPAVLNAMKGAALPAAFLSGPIGMAAGGSLALDALSSAYEDPSAMNIGMAGLSALPFAKAFKAAPKALGKFEGRQILQGPLRKPKEAPVDWDAMSGIRQADKAPASKVSRMRNTEDELLEGVEPAPTSYLDRSHQDFLKRNSRPESLQALEMLDDVPTPQGGGSMDEVLASISSMNPNVPKGRMPTAMDDFAGRIPKKKSTLPKPHVRMPQGGVKTDAEMSVLAREAENGRGSIGNSRFHRDIANMDRDYRRHTGRF